MNQVIFLTTISGSLKGCMADINKPLLRKIVVNQDQIDYKLPDDYESMDDYVLTMELECETGYFILNYISINNEILNNNYDFVDEIIYKSK